MAEKDALMHWIVITYLSNHWLWDCFHHNQYILPEATYLDNNSLSDHSLLPPTLVLCTSFHECIEYFDTYYHEWGCYGIYAFLRTALRIMIANGYGIYDVMDVANGYARGLLTTLSKLPYSRQGRHQSLQHTAQSLYWAIQWIPCREVLPPWIARYLPYGYIGQVNSNRYWLGGAPPPSLITRMEVKCR